MSSDITGRRFDEPAAVVTVPPRWPSSEQAASTVAHALVIDAGQTV